MATEVFQTDSGDVFYDKRGLGDPLVLVHDVYVGADHEEFARNIAPLAGRFTVYAIDLLGYGDSDAPRVAYTAQLYHHLLRDFIHQVIGRPAHVVASGLSGGFAVRLGVYNEGAVERITLLSPQDKPGAPDSPGAVQHLQQFVLGTLKAAVGLYETVSQPNELATFLRSRYAVPRRATAERLAQLLYNARRVNAMYPYVSLVTNQLDTDLFRWIRYVRSPVQVVWGAGLGKPPADRILAPAAWSRGKRIDVVDGAAHWPHDEQSAKVNALIEAFARESVAGG